MTTKRLLALLTLTAATATLVYRFAAPGNDRPENLLTEESEEERENGDDRARFQEARMRYEFDMIKNPVTGTISPEVFEREMALARQLPERQQEISFSSSEARNTSVLNAYIPAGPNNVGGRTRAIAYDLRYNGSSNRVIIAGSVSGGILRSTDGGGSWSLVTPQNDIHSFTTIVQDPRAGSQDIWYAAGGEAYGNSASELGAAYMGYGIWKSTNNGASWTKLTLTNITGAGGLGTELTAFDHPFDYVHRLVVSPINGHLFVAGHRRVLRSTDGGASFQQILGGTTGATSTNGQTDVAVTSSGRVLAAFNGGNPEKALRGIWTSTTGASGSFARIAGGTALGVDSVDGWRGNDLGQSSRRILMSLAPSNNNIVYVIYDNGLSSEDPDLEPEADLWRMDISNNTFTWSNRSANMPDFENGNLSGSDPFTHQGGYDLLVRVKPDNPNVVYVGGTNLYRSTDGFATDDNTAWIGGYNTNFTYALYPNSHADIHELVFNPTNANEAICGNDGGIQRTSNISASTVSWTYIKNYQTLQYYYVAIDPEAGRNNFVGGAQDNGTQFRDKLGLLGSTADSNNHRRLIGGDGTAVGISNLELSNQNQYLYGGSQYGNINRIRITNGVTSNNIRPSGLTPAFPGATSEYGEFVTNFRLNPDNTEDLYYVNFNRLFRTTTASSVAGGGWTELTTAGTTIDPNGSTGGYNSIRAIGFSRGPYTSSHVLYLGTTGGKIFRINDPRNAAATVTPVDITPANLLGNVQDIAVNPNNDDEIIAVVSSYDVLGNNPVQVTNIWWTKNAKSANPTWKNAEGNLTLASVRSAAIVVKKEGNTSVTEYYVGTSVGLYSVAGLGATLDANGSPQWQREGGTTLNYAVVQSLAYRPSDNVLVVGTHGNGMYYTFLGSPDFRPNLNTGINPVTNDRNFISQVFPTVGNGTVYYRTGNMLGVRGLQLQLLDLSGRTVWSERTAFQSGSFQLGRFPRGTYILSIYSEDRKYRHIQKLIRN